MSNWTHIVASIDAETYIYSKDIQSVVEDMIKNAPKITGSERDADIFVNKLSGYNCSMSFDCNACQYKDTLQSDDEGFWCDAPEGFVCPDGKYQTRVVITVIGDLRDRHREQTKREWLAFKDYIAKHINENGFCIRNCSCNILGY